MKNKSVETAAPLIADDSPVIRLAQVYHLAAIARSLSASTESSKQASLALLNKYTSEALGKYSNKISQYGFLYQSYYLNDFIQSPINAIRAINKLAMNISDLKTLVKNLKEDKGIPIDEVNILNSAVLYFASLDKDREKRSFINVAKTSRKWASDVNRLLGKTAIVKQDESSKVTTLLETLLSIVKQIKPKASTYKLTTEEKLRLSDLSRLRYNKTMSALKLLYLEQLSGYVVSNNDTPVDVNKAIKYLNTLGHEIHWIPEVPREVKLNVSVRAGKLTFYTDTFNPLNGGIAPGSTGIKLSSSFDKTTKQGAYIQFKAPNAATITRLYTTEHKNEAQTSKFTKSEAVIKDFDKFVTRWIKDMSNRDDDPTTRMISSVCYMVYLTGMRIGTRIKSAASVTGVMTYGAMSLRFEHIRLNAKTITVEYSGKKNVKQKHVITIEKPADKLLYKNLESFMKGKKKGDIVFSWKYKTGTEKTLHTGILTAYLKSVGFPAGIHKVRHARGTQFMLNNLAKNKWKPSIKANTTLKMQKEAEDWFKLKILEPIAGFLGHKSAGDKLLWKTTVTNYCNPKPIVEWFTQNQLRVPKWVPVKEPTEEASVPLIKA